MLNIRNTAIFTVATVFSLATATAGTDEDVLERIRPIGKVNVKEAVNTQPVAVATQPPTTAPKPPPAATPVVAPTAAAQPPVAAAAPSAVSVGQKTYEGICFACHAVGAAGSPKFGDKAAWGPRIAKGPEALLHSTVNGTAKGMPPRGGCSTCSDDDLKAAVEYMVAHGK